MKSDIKAFPKLQDAKHWITWYTKTKGQARIQDVDDIFHPSYIALSPMDKLHFN